MAREETWQQEVTHLTAALNPNVIMYAIASVLTLHTLISTTKKSVCCFKMNHFILFAHI
jgi:hypothetical protein